MLDIQKENPFLKLKARSVFLWFLIITFALGFISGFVGSLLKLRINDPIMTYIFYCLSFILLCIWALRRCYNLQINPKYLIGKLQTNYRWLPIVGIVVALILFSLGAALLTFYFLSLLSPSLLKSLLKSIATDNSRTSFPTVYNWLYTISVVVVAPITEEFIFRGILLHRWAIKWGLTPAILVSSIIFGLCHVNPLGLSVFGIIMALLYIKSRTLIVPMVAHALNNFFVIVMQFIPSKSSSLNPNSNIYSFWQVGILLIAVSLPFIISFIYKNWSNKRVPLPYFANASQ